MNRAVSRIEVAGFKLKIKTVSGNQIAVLGTLNSTDYDIQSDMYVKFNVSSIQSQLNIGQYYKIQLAYINKQSVIGYYSTVGVVKYTTEPVVEISGLTFGSVNMHNYRYVGVYSQASDGQDSTEKMYSSRFKVYDNDDNIIKDSGEIIHNINNDIIPNESQEEFVLSMDLNLDTSYYIQFSVTTTNGLEKSSNRYRIMQRRSINPEINAELVATLDPDNGNILLTMNDTIDSVVSGTFLISRASSLNGYAWEEFRRFNLQSMIPDQWSLLDCTIEQGATYRYSLQQYNENGIYSDRLCSKDIFADFEDAFLYDGERQLKIRFNPKVSTFKHDILETKTETMGSKHPFVTRNGNVNYVELALSGLISYQMDEAELFMTKEELGISSNITDLTGENITAERIFKTAVLEWLTDGNAKIFRSPTEGNFIVRLMNVSLSPNDTVGRMLHTFSCTAYEIADYTTDNLEYYGLIDPTENLKTMTRWTTIDLTKIDTSKYDISKDDNYNSGVEKIQINDKVAYSVFFVDMMPGSMIFIDGEPIKIGATGSYSAQATTTPFSKIEVATDSLSYGLLTYSYQTKAVSVFGLIQQISIEDVPCQQLIGVVKAPSKENKDLYEITDIYSYIQDIKTTVLKLSMARFIKRDVEYVFCEATSEKDFNPNTKYTYYSDAGCNNIVTSLDTLKLYQIRCKRTDERKIPGEGVYVDANSAIFSPYLNYYLDGQKGLDQMPVEITDDLFQIFIDGEAIDITETEKYELSSLDDVKIIIPQNGVISEIGYSKQISTYSFESDESGESEVIAAKGDYNTYLSEYKKVKSDVNKEESDVELARSNVKQYYKDFIRSLDSAITTYRKENGIE
jgi:hypothetical protein